MLQTSGRNFSGFVTGSGKSHLINWIKIKYDNEIENNNLKCFASLIRRRNGSLKDALDQLIEQLPTEYQNYVQKVSDAVKNF